MGNTRSKGEIKELFLFLMREDTPEDHWDRVFSLEFTLNELLFEVETEEVRNAIERAPQKVTQGLLKAITILEETSHLIFDLDPERLAMTENAVKILVKLLPVTLESKSCMAEFWWGPSLPAFRLLKALQGLMFTPEYAVVRCFNTESIDKFNEVHGRLLWKGGLVFDISYETSPEMWRRRCELLKLLLSVMCEELYCEINEVQGNHFPWVWLLVNQANIYCTQLVFTLLNLVLTSCHKEVGGLPYSSYWNDDVQDSVYHMALGALNLLMHYSPPVELLPEFGPLIDLILSRKFTEDSYRRNEIKLTIAQIDKEKDLKFLVKNLIRLVSDELDANNTYLPNSVQGLEKGPGAVFLLWKFLESSSKGAVAFAKDPNMPHGVMGLLYHLETAYESPQLFGLFSTCCQCLLKLSTHREFAVQLNIPAKKYPLNLVSCRGNYTDILVQSLCYYIGLRKEHLFPVLSEVMITLANLSPFIKCIEQDTGKSVISVFSHLSSKPFLLAEQYNHFLLFYATEFINNIIHCQWNGASFLVLELLRRKEVFFKLWRMEVQALNDSVNGEDLTEGEIQLNSDPEGEEEDKEEDSGNEGQSLREQGAEEALELVSGYWEPTERWLMQWKQKLPIKLIFETIQFLRDKVLEFTKKHPRAKDVELAAMIKEECLIGIISPPQGFSIRDVQLPEYMHYWYASYIWASLYSSQPDCLPIPLPHIKLFTS